MTPEEKEKIVVALEQHNFWAHNYGSLNSPEYFWHHENCHDIIKEVKNTFVIYSNLNSQAIPFDKIETVEDVETLSKLCINED